MRVPIAIALVLVLAAPALAQPPVSPSLWIEAEDLARSGALRDRSGAGNQPELVRFNGNATDGLVGSGSAGDPWAIRFDGVDDVIATTTQLQAPTNLTIDVRFRTTVAGGKIVGFEGSANGSSGQFDRHVFLRDDGRVAFGVWIGTGSVVESERSLADGAWHTVVATLAVNATASRLGLYVDGALVNGSSTLRPASYAGYWRVGGGSFSSWSQAPKARFFEGDVASVRIYDDALPASAILAPAPPPSGEVFAQQAPPADIAGSVATALAAAGVASLAAARGFDLFSFARKLAQGAAADKMKDRTKGLLELRLPSILAGAVALALMAVLVAAGKPGALSGRAFWEALLVAGLATLVLKSVAAAGAALLARAGNAAPRYHLWTAGTVTLALTSLLFHAPFGYTGFVERAKTDAAPDRRRDARVALATPGLSAFAAGLFLAFADATGAPFAALGLTLSLGALAAGALPFPMLAGLAVWRWSKVAGGALALAGLAPYVLFEAGLLPAIAVWLIAGAGIAAFAWAVATERRGHPQRPQSSAA